MWRPFQPSRWLENINNEAAPMSGEEVAAL
jgi:hypothetical protein